MPAKSGRPTPMAVPSGADVLSTVAVRFKTEPELAPQTRLTWGNGLTSLALAGSHPGGYPVDRGSVGRGDKLLKHWHPHLDDTLAFTRRTRPRSLCSEEDAPQLIKRQARPASNPFEIVRFSR
jgi:hypothetical protein